MLLLWLLLLLLLLLLLRYAALLVEQFLENVNKVTHKLWFFSFFFVSTFKVK